MKKVDRRIGKAPVNKVIWTQQEVELLKQNFERLSLEKLAALVSRPVSTLRHKLKRLGLKRGQKHYAWTECQTDFLLRNYQTGGNVEIAERMNKRWPRARPWTKKHVQKKMDNMGIRRTPEEVQTILRKNRREKRYNLTPARAKYREMVQKLTDDYILSRCLRISKVNRERIKKEHPKLIEYTRQRIIQKRQPRETLAEI